MTSLADGREDTLGSSPPNREIHARGPGPTLEELRAAYLDLLKLALCDLTGVTTRTVTWTGDRRLFSRQLSPEQREWRVAGKDWPENALTMVGLMRLDHLQSCVESIVAHGVAGDLIEVGSWRAGASLLMRATLDSLGARERTVWVADSFQGFPAPESDGRGEDREVDQGLSGYDYFAAPLQEVRDYFARYGCEQGVKFVPGFFEETLPNLGRRRWALIRVDGDTYKSTRLALDLFYPDLSVGGYVVIDDYQHGYLPQCRQAVDDLRTEHGIAEPLERIDWNAVCWRRESAPASEAALAPERSPVAAADDMSRVAAARERAPIATDRELQLEDELADLRDRIAVLEAELRR